MTDQEREGMDILNFCIRVLKWNREQEQPPIEITKEYWVAAELLKLYALKQTEQEPVAWLVKDQVDGCWYPSTIKNPAGSINGESLPLYTKEQS